MKKCPKCGKENTNNSNYCEYCGENLTGSNKPVGNDKTKKTLTAIVGVLALGLVVGGTILLINHRDNANVDPHTSTETAATSKTSSEAASEYTGWYRACRRRQPENRAHIPKSPAANRAPFEAFCL